MPDDCIASTLFREKYLILKVNNPYSFYFIFYCLDAVVIYEQYTQISNNYCLLFRSESKICSKYSMMFHWIQCNLWHRMVSITPL